MFFSSYTKDFKHITKVILLLLPAIVGMLFIICINKKDYVIFPGRHIVTAYDDGILKGNSNLNHLEVITGNKIYFSYTLGNNFFSPYIGIRFNHPSKPVYDLSGYDYVEIDLQAENSRAIPVMINIKYPNYMIGTDTVAFRPLWKEIDYVKDQRVYKLPLADFKTPNWWFLYTKSTKTDIAPPDFTQVSGIAIQSCQLLPTNQKESVIINSIRLYKDIKMEALAVILVLLIFYLFVFFISKIKQNQIVLFPHKKLDVGNIEDEETKKLIHYISENYDNTDLCSAMLQKKLGLTETKISSILKNNFGVTFKKYLNQVRLQEAKRLLEQTDRQIMEVAYSVGYGNVSHFNKVFKKSEGCAPNEYRKKSQERYHK